MVLAKDEQVLKEWEYASSKVKTVETIYSLTVTNKRIISQSKSNRKNTHEEIPVSEVKGISSSHETASKFWAIVLMVLGGLCVLVPLIVLLVQEDADFNASIILSWLVGAYLIYLGYVRWDQGVFVLTITTKGKEGSPMVMGAMKIFKSFFKGKVKIKVNNAEAEDIVETLGALIVG
ncbi:MAG: hypothetical protein IJX96_01345 [Clostridia bacterium]|nr:hypothetical protein [Clostridia bacterium]